MAASYSRHGTQYAAPAKTLPIKMPSHATTYHPTSRAAMSPPDYSDSGYHTASSAYSRHSGRGSTSDRSDRSYAPSHSSGDYDDFRHGSHDVVDMLSDRMNSAFDPITMDKQLARQAQE